MILLAHLIFGAAIASKIHNPFLAVVLAFLSHYFLDFMPHTEYDIKNIHLIKGKQWRKIYPEILKVLLDFLSGILLISSKELLNWSNISLVKGNKNNTFLSSTCCAHINIMLILVDCNFFLYVLNNCNINDN